MLLLFSLVTFVSFQVRFKLPGGRCVIRGYKN